MHQIGVSQTSSRQPMFNAPTGIVVVLGILLAIHLVRTALQAYWPEWDGWLVGATAFIPARYSDPEASVLPMSPYADYTSWITYMLIHGSFLHLMFNSAWLLAFGGAVANRIGSARCIAFAIVCGCAGALMFLFWNWGQFAPMVGASGAISGLMGAALRFLYPALDRGRGSLRHIHYHMMTTPLMSLNEAVRDRRIQITVGLLVLLNVIATFGVGPGASEGPIAWEAHAGGFLAGFFLYGFFDTAVRNEDSAPFDTMSPGDDTPSQQPTIH